MCIVLCQHPLPLLLLSARNFVTPFSSSRICPSSTSGHRCLPCSHLLPHPHLHRLLTTTFRLLLPPTSAILCFRFLLVSRFRFLFTGSFPTSDIHVAYQSPVSSLVGLPRRCSSNGSGNDDCHPPPIECISSAICHSGPASGLHAFHVSRM